MKSPIITKTPAANRGFQKTYGVRASKIDVFYRTSPQKTSGTCISFENPEVRALQGGIYE